MLLFLKSNSEIRIFLPSFLSRKNCTSYIGKLTNLMYLWLSLLFQSLSVVCGCLHEFAQLRALCGSVQPESWAVWLADVERPPSMGHLRSKLRWQNTRNPNLPVHLALSNLGGGPDDTWLGGVSFLPLCKLFLALPTRNKLFFLSGKGTRKIFPSHITPPFYQFCEQTFYFLQFAKQTIFSSLFGEQSFFFQKNPPQPPPRIIWSGPKWLVTLVKFHWTILTCSASTWRDDNTSRTRVCMAKRYPFGCILQCDFIAMSRPSHGPVVCASWSYRLLTLG